MNPGNRPISQNEEKRINDCVCVLEQPTDSMRSMAHRTNDENENN